MEDECPYSKTQLFGIDVVSYRGMVGKPSTLVACPECGGIYRVYPNGKGLHFPLHSSNHTTRVRSHYRYVNGEWKWIEEK